MESRTFKFRGKRTDGAGNWVFGSLVTENENRSFIISSFEVGYNSTLKPIAHLVIPNTVSQFTGKFGSEDGKEIYEGDRVIDEQTEYVVYWDKERACFAVTSGDGFHQTLEEYAPTDVIGTVR